MIQETEGSQQEAESPRDNPTCMESYLQKLGTGSKSSTDDTPPLAEKTQGKSIFVTNKTVRK